MTTARLAGGQLPDNRRATELYALAALVLGIGAGINSREPATAITLIAAGIAIAAFVASTRGSTSTGERFLVRILAIGIGANLFIGLIAPALLDAWYRPLLALIGISALGAAFVPRLRNTLVVAVVLGQFVISAWVLTDLDPPDMDVHLFQQAGSQALIGLENPYELRYRNIYGEGTELYAPELQSGEFVNFGFPYPPLSLLMAAPGYVLAGDYRHATVVVMSVTALLLAFMRPGAIGAGIASLYVLSPLTLRVVYNGWTEPFVGLLLAAAVFTAIRLPRLTPLMLGLLIASKQYVLPVLLPAVILLTGVRRLTGLTRLIVVPLVVAAVTVLPFLLWNPGEFIHSVLLVQAYQPFRPDSVGIAGLLARMELWVTPTWVAFAGGGIALLAVTSRAPRTPAGFAGATAVFFFVFFLLSKQAFMNYYYLVLVALACAVGGAMIARSSGHGVDAGSAENGAREH